LKISNNNYVDLSKIFSPTIIKELIKNGHSYKLKNILSELGVLPQINLKNTVSTLFDEIYKVLKINYRNEYIFKNTLIKNILLGKHTLNTAFMINECAVGNSKADCVIFNGTSTVYEIKSEYDTFLRLSNQINDYKKAFEYVYIVIPDKSIDKLKNHLDDDYIGIMQLNKNNTITKIRNAKSNKQTFDKEVIFNLLRKKEYIKIIQKKYGIIPDMPNTKIYSYCKNLFFALEIDTIHNEVISILKERGNDKLLKEVISNTPYSLKALSLQLKLTKKEKQDFLNLLNKEIQHII